MNSSDDFDFLETQSILENYLIDSRNVNRLRVIDLRETRKIYSGDQGRFGPSTRGSNAFGISEKRRRYGFAVPPRF